MSLDMGVGFRDDEILNNEKKEKEFLELVGKVFAGLNLSLCISGLFANFAIIFMILLLKDYKKSATHWYVLQLAIADTIFLLTVPFKASSHLNSGWIYSVGLCKTVEGILFINYYASIIFLMVMSIDRYLAVCHSLSSGLNVLRKEAASYIITACVWIIAICLAIPIIMFSDVVGNYPNCDCTAVFPIDKNSTIEECLTSTNGDPLLEVICRSEGKCVDYNDFLGVPGEGDYDSNVTGNGDYDSIGGENLGEYGSESENALGMGRYNYLGYGLDLGSENGLSTDSDSQFSETGNVNTEPIPFQYEGACHYFENPYEWKLFIWLNFGFLFLLPIAIMTVCYGLIIYRLSKMPVQSSRTEKDRWRITLMCIILVTVFICCWILFHSLHIGKIFGIPFSGNTCYVLTNVSVSFAFLNSVLNPYLYSFLGTGCQRKLDTLKSVGAVQQIISLKSRGSTFMTSNFRSRSKFSEKESSHHSNENQSIAHTGSTKLVTEREKSVKN